MIFTIYDTKSRIYTEMNAAFIRIFKKKIIVLYAFFKDKYL